MTNLELELKLRALIFEERKITNEILELINLAVERKLYLELGFASLFDWLTRSFGYSNAAAYRRIEAAKLLKAVPDAAEKLQLGIVNLSNLSCVQTMIRAQEKISGQEVSQMKKAELVGQIEHKSLRETEQILYATFPEVAKQVNQERRVILDQNRTRHMMTLINHVTEDLNRAKELLSHKFPNGSDADIIEYALKFMLDRVDPLRKVPSLTRMSRRGVLRATMQASRAKCTFQNPTTRQVCGSTYQVQIDHIVPKALGGGDDPENLRVLCRQHNVLMGERALGKAKMNQWRKK